MANFEIHREKYLMFRSDAEREENSSPTRIEAYFNACFHLIEAQASLSGIHIHKHQSVRRVLEENPDIFGAASDNIWRSFQEIENQIRPGQVYGSSINGKKLSRTKELIKSIEGLCGL